MEKKDFASGASGANSGMIHGGIRYLRTDPAVTGLASLDSGYIQKIAPHLLFRVPFIFPVLRAGAEPALSEQAYLYAAEVFFSAYDRYQPLKKGLPSSRLTAAETLALEPGIRPEIVGAVTTDEWGIDPQRLCALNALDARDHGATLYTHTKVTALPRGAGGRLLGAEISAGAGASCSPRAVLNAAGPWAPLVAKLAGVAVETAPGQGRAPDARSPALELRGHHQRHRWSPDLHLSARDHLDHRHHRRRLLRRSRPARGHRG